jgi:hypothetical protein
MTTMFGSSTLGGSRERITDHMFKLTLNGKPFNSQDLEKAMREAALEQLKEHVHEQLSSIRLPGTGEFPLVQVLGSDLDDVCVQVEGSVELLALVRERISPEELEQYTLIETTPSSRPKVFLSFAWEDHDTARQIAETLQANGVDTWWAEWEIRAGDSLRQKIDEGLGACTHFLVLLTPISISKPWVNQEMDAGLMQKLQAKARFLPVRKDLPHTSLPPLLQGMYSPELRDFDKDLTRLVLDIHEVSRKPAIGPVPAAADRAVNTGYSPAATAIAKLFVERTQHASYLDPNMSPQEIAEATGLSEEDTEDALYELKNFVEYEYGNVTAFTELFATFDKHYKEWDPSQDALRIAADALNDDKFPDAPKAIAERYQWNARRLNPAINYLKSRKLMDVLEALGTHPFIASHLFKNDATRRFVKSRS